MNNFNDIVAQFYSAAAKYSAGIQPYAIKLFLALLLIDILVTWIQFTAEGQLDASHFLGRLIKHILSGGFVYLMIVNAFSWMNAVVKSFSTIGAAVTGLPALSPQTVLQLGANMAGTIFDAPANASMMTNIELAIVQSVAAFFVLLSFVVTAAMLILTLIEAYLVVGGGVILLGLGANRFTAPAAEGYFGYVIRVGVRLLFFYLVLAVGVQMATQWSAALLRCVQAGACDPPLVDYLRRSTKFHRDHSLFRKPVCLNDAHIRRVGNHLHDSDHCCAPYGGQYCWRHGRPRAEPRVRGRIYRSDRHSADHKRPPDRIQQSRSAWERWRRQQQRSHWLGQRDGFRSTDPTARQSRHRRRTACACPERRSRHIGHAITRSKYNADESRHSALWKRQHQHNGDE